MTVVINPGTGPVGGATEDNARHACEQFVLALKASGATALFDGTLGTPREGRWPATITVDGRTHHVDMPGCDPAITRSSTPFVSPRMYVDGSSWWWKYALAVIIGDDGVEL